MTVNTIHEGNTPQPLNVDSRSPQRASIEASKTNTAGTQATESRANVDKQAQAAAAAENSAKREQSSRQNTESRSGGNNGRRINVFA